MDSFLLIVPWLNPVACAISFWVLPDFVMLAITLRFAAQMRGICQS
jgi:hypothetical protein